MGAKTATSMFASSAAVEPNGTMLMDVMDENADVDIELDMIKADLSSQSDKQPKLEEHQKPIRNYRSISTPPRLHSPNTTGSAKKRKAEIRVQKLVRPKVVQVQTARAAKTIAKSFLWPFLRKLTELYAFNPFIFIFNMILVAQK